MFETFFTLAICFIIFQLKDLHDPKNCIKHKLDLYNHIKWAFEPCTSIHECYIHTLIFLSSKLLFDLIIHWFGWTLKSHSFLCNLISWHLRSDIKALFGSFVPFKLTLCMLKHDFPLLTILSLHVNLFFHLQIIFPRLSPKNKYLPF